MTMTRNTKDRAKAHLANYANASGLTLFALLDAYMAGTLPGIKMEAIGRIMGRYDGVAASDIYTDLMDLKD